MSIPLDALREAARGNDLDVVHMTRKTLRAMVEELEIRRSAMDRPAARSRVNQSLQDLHGAHRQ